MDGSCMLQEDRYMQDSNEHAGGYQPGNVYPPTTPPTYNRGRKGITFLQTMLLLAMLGVGLFAGWAFGSRNAQGSAPQGSATNSTSAVSTPIAGSVEEARTQVIAKMRPSVVQINVRRQNGGGLGSGVVIDKGGYIVTNNHVVEGANAVTVVFSNGTTLPGQIVGTAPGDDLAVVKVDPAKIKLTVAPIGDSSKLQVGQEVLAIGNPLGITQTVTNGIVSALNRNVSTGKNGTVLPGTIQTDAPINPGNSGGALVDLQGNLIGVPTLTAIDPEFNTPANGVGFAIPSNRVKFIVPQLIESGKVTSTGRAGMGIQGATVDQSAAQQYQLPVDHGVLIADVTPGGPAARAGLKVNDIIVQVDNNQIVDTSTLSDALLSKNPGDTVEVTVYRGNQEQKFTVRLGELPPKA